MNVIVLVVLGLAVVFKDCGIFFKDEELWEPKDWYPPLCPPKSLKEELLRDEDFTEVDQKARAAPNSVEESFSKLVHHLTGRLNSDLHKLRSIFVWMGAQNVGCRQETESCKNEHSPTFYLQKACQDGNLIGKLFAKLCRGARIPCILVTGKARGVSYDPGDDDITGECTWAVVYVAGSWRFVFPYWAFVKKDRYQKKDWMLVEDCGKAARTRFTAIDDKLISDFDEYFFLTDPEEMKYICHSHDKEKQLVTKPRTKEEFFASPYFKTSYFSSGWLLIRPLTCLIKAEAGRCSLDLLSPEKDCKLYYKLFFDECRSWTTFPQEFQTDRYVIITKRTVRTESVMIRLPVSGTYKLELTASHQGKRSTFAHFRIDCDYVEPETRPFPPYPKNGYGFTETASDSGLSEPSHTEGIVSVRSGGEINISFNVSLEIKIKARLLHYIRASEDLRDNVSVGRDKHSAKVTAKLPADDPSPEYSLEVDTIKVMKHAGRLRGAFTKKQVLNYLLTSDKTLNAVIMDMDRKQTLQCYEDVSVAVAKDDAKLLERAASRVKMAGIKDPMLEQKIRVKEAKSNRVREELLACVRERNLDRLNRALTDCIGRKLPNKREEDEAKTALLALCEEEMEKAITNQNLQEIRECLNKIANTCVGKEAREKVWFKDAQQVFWDLEELQNNKRKVQLLTDEDMVNMFKPPDDVINVLFATFILLGESKGKLNTWQKIWTKLSQTNVNQLLGTLTLFDDSELTREQVDLAEDKLLRCSGSFGNDQVYTTLYSWCMDRVKTFRLKEKFTRRN